MHIGLSSEPWISELSYLLGGPRARWCLAGAMRIPCSTFTCARAWTHCCVLTPVHTAPDHDRLHAGSSGIVRRSLTDTRPFPGMYISAIMPGTALHALCRRCNSYYTLEDLHNLR